jgi:hypothetical protein
MRRRRLAAPARSGTEYTNMKNPLESVWWCVVALYAVLFVHEPEGTEGGAA